ncbi:MAG: cell division protein FtsK, partial [Lachnospiraceae bacterium]|nr:cell division protein FtsK [Lachnospiraceae bacterium]
INDSLADKPKLIRESYRYLQDVPVCVDLLQHRIIGVIGGRGRRGSYEILKTLVAQIAGNNCYTDVKMAFIYDETRAAAGNPVWEFAKWLPHVWSEDKKTRFVAANRSDASDVFYEIASVLRMRAEDMEQNRAREKEIPKPYYLLFLDDSSMLEGELIAKYVYDTTKDYGISTVVMVESYEDLPNACGYIIENTSQFRGIYPVNDSGEGRVEVAFDTVSSDSLEVFARRLASIEVKEEEIGGEIPNVLTFFDMYGVNHPQELEVLERWKKNRTYDSMKAMVGQKSGGADCYLDIHEKYHGPHGLVAGTTGSGKSETLQTYMLSLAMNYSPDDIGFFVIDYKGGGMANLFEGLPHMIGQISNLSGNQVHRAMVSIKSENLRRQRIFNEHGVNNINLYTRLYKNNEASIPVPHMFIIIDEFAELKREEPDFMRELISVAQVGRSLGVHLILATQKPSGTVDDNIWSNSKFRLCLRVQDRQDSVDMLHRPDAAYITQAGRCFLQVGNDELFELFQSAWSGAAYDEDAGNVQTNIAQMLTLNGRAALLGSHAQLVQKERSKSRWIESLIIGIDAAAGQIGCRVSDGAANKLLGQKMAGFVFDKLEQEGIEYPPSDYNVHRVLDLITVYGTLLEREPRLVNAKNKVDIIIKYAESERRKLPERKEKTQLDAVVEHLAVLARDNGYVHNLQLWLPVLPTEMYLSDLEEYDTHAFDGERWPDTMEQYSLETMVGLLDDPENQSQVPLTVDLAADGNHAIIGTVVSGKSTFLLTYLYSLMHRYTPEQINIYIADYSSKMLGALSGAPHVGGIMFEEDEEKVAKFMTMLGRMLEERKKLFSGGSYSQYIQANGMTLPSAIIVIDNMASFRAKTDGIYDDFLINILKEGVNYGIYVVATAAGFNMNEIPGRMSDNFRTVICLEMNEKYAYTDVLRTLHISVLPEENVKGRGILKLGEAILEFQTALPLPAEDDYKRAAAIEERLSVMQQAWRGKKARRIPEIPEEPVWSEYKELDDVAEKVEEGKTLPFGYDRKDASIYGIDLTDNYCYMVSGKARTGKSNLLRVMIHSAALCGAQIAVVDFGGDLEYAAKSAQANYIGSIGALQTYFEGLVPVFRERSQTKKQYSA